jgi:hypothetical protein
MKLTKFNKNSYKCEDSFSVQVRHNPAQIVRFGDMCLLMLLHAYKLALCNGRGDGVEQNEV